MVLPKVKTLYHGEHHTCHITSAALVQGRRQLVYTGMVMCTGHVCVHIW